MVNAGLTALQRVAQSTWRDQLSFLLRGNGSCGRIASDLGGVAVMDTVSEREKWLAEQAFREREIALKERHQALQEREAQQKQRQAAWSNPLALAILAAAVAGAGNAAVAWFNGRAQIERERTASQSQLALEETKAEAGRILEVIKTGDPDKAAENLRFLLDAGLITDPERRQSVLAFLKQRQPGEGPSTPAPAGTPAPANTLPRLSTAEKQELVGGPQVQTDAQGNSFIDPNDPWIVANIVEVEIPALARTLSGSGKVRFHRAAAASLQAAFAEIEQLGLLGDIRSFDGAFVARTIRGNRALSAHALGLAVDINVRWNPFGTEPAPAGSEGTVVRLVPVFAKHGFTWGGWATLPEGNHFEFVDKLVLATPKSAP